MPASTAVYLSAGYIIHASFCNLQLQHWLEMQGENLGIDLNLVSPLIPCLIFFVFQQVLWEIDFAIF